MGAAVNRGPHDPRRQMASVYRGDYVRESLPRSMTELPSQTRAAADATRVAELSKQLRKSTDPLERDRISQDLTFECLRAAHRAGRI